MAILKTKIVLRNDLAANWSLNNPLLLAGEAGFEKDTNRFKIGDGVNHWNDLPYANKTGDGQALELNEKTGVLTLKNWNKQYYKWDNENGIYTLVEGWSNNLEPKVTEDGVLGWYEPNPTINNRVAALEAKDLTHDEELVALRGELANYLNLSGGALTGALVLEDGGKAISENVIDAKIAAAISSAGHLKREIVEVLPSVDEADPNTIYMIKVETATQGDKYLEWMVIDNEFVQIGDTTVDLTPYVKKVEGAKQSNLPAFDNEGGLVDSGYSVAALQKINEQKKFEITSYPEGTIINYSDTEIRMMVPKDYVWEHQAVGSTGNANMYYAGFKAYAPENAVSFREGDQGVLEDTVSYFENNNFAGIDAYGRKYSIVWLALASYDTDSDTWTYFGKNSSNDRYVGWNYVVEWYDENGKPIYNDNIRINLSNEECHYNVEPYFMGKVIKSITVNGEEYEVVDNKVDIKIDAISTTVKESDEIGIAEDSSLYIKQIPISKLTAGDDELVLNGGSSDF